MNTKQTLLAIGMMMLLGTAAPVRAQDAAGKAGKVGVKNVEVNEAAKLLQQEKGIVVLDVRTAREYSEGHIAGAKNIDFNGADFEKKIAALEKDKKYLVHCASGGRSAKARDMMKRMNFESIYHLEGGLRAWEKAGKPVQR